MPRKYRGVRARSLGTQAPLITSNSGMPEGLPNSMSDPYTRMGNQTRARTQLTQRAHARRRAARAAVPVRRSRDSGQTLVEFALIFPLFIILVMGVIEF